MSSHNQTETAGVTRHQMTRNTRKWVWLSVMGAMLLIGGALWGATYDYPYYSNAGLTDAHDMYVYPQCIGTGAYQWQPRIYSANTRYVYLYSDNSTSYKKYLNWATGSNGWYPYGESCPGFTTSYWRVYVPYNSAGGLVKVLDYKAQLSCNSSVAPTGTYRTNEVDGMKSYSANANQNVTIENEAWPSDNQMRMYMYVCVASGDYVRLYDYTGSNYQTFTNVCGTYWSNWRRTKYTRVNLTTDGGTNKGAVHAFRIYRYETGFSNTAPTISSVTAYPYNNAMGRGGDNWYRVQVNFRDTDSSYNYNTTAGWEYGLDAWDHGSAWPGINLQVFRSGRTGYTSIDAAHNAYYSTQYETCLHHNEDSAISSSCYEKSGSTWTNYGSGTGTFVRGYSYSYGGQGNEARDNYMVFSFRPKSDAYTGTWYLRAFVRDSAGAETYADKAVTIVNEGYAPGGNYRGYAYKDYWDGTLTGQSGGALYYYWDAPAGGSTPAGNFGYDWNGGGPGGQSDDFFVRLRANLNYPWSYYYWRTEGDDGHRVYLNGSDIADSWGSTSQDVKTSGWYHISGNQNTYAEMFNDGGDAYYSLNWYRDTTAPTVSVSAETSAIINGAWYKTNYWIKGSMSDSLNLLHASWAWKWDGWPSSTPAHNISTSATSYTTGATYIPSDGTHTLYMRGWDSSDNLTNKSYAFHRDTGAPVMTLTSCSYHNGSNWVAISGCSGDSTYNLKYGRIQVCGTTVDSYTGVGGNYLNLDGNNNTGDISMGSGGSWCGEYTSSGVNQYFFRAKDTVSSSYGGPSWTNWYDGPSPVTFRVDTAAPPTPTATNPGFHADNLGEAYATWNAVTDNGTGVDPYKYTAGVKYYQWYCKTGATRDDVLSPWSGANCPTPTGTTTGTSTPTMTGIPAGTWVGFAVRAWDNVDNVSSFRVITGHTIAVPTVVSSTPTTGTSYAGMRSYRFTTTYSDEDGAEDLDYLRLLINNGVTCSVSNGEFCGLVTNPCRASAGWGVQGHYYSYNGSTWLDGGAVNTGAPVSTNATSLQASAWCDSANKQVIVYWDLTFKYAWNDESLNIYLYARDVHGLNSGWIDKGNWLTENDMVVDNFWETASSYNPGANVTLKGTVNYEPHHTVVHPSSYSDTITFNHYSYGGGYYPKYEEIWSPSWPNPIVYKFDRDLRPRGSLSLYYDRVMQVAGDVDGHVYYIAGWGNGSLHVVRWDPNKDKATMEWDRSVISQSWGAAWTHMGGIAIDEDYVYVAEARTVSNSNSEVCVLKKYDGSLVRCQSGLNPGYRMTGGMAVANGFLYMPDEDSSIVRVYPISYGPNGPEFGSMVHSFSTAAPVRSAFFDGEYYNVSDAGSSVSYRYRISSGNAFMARPSDPDYYVTVGDEDNGHTQVYSVDSMNMFTGYRSIDVPQMHGTLGSDQVSYANAEPSPASFHAHVYNTPVGAQQGMRSTAVVINDVAPQTLGAYVDDVTGSTIYARYKNYTFRADFKDDNGASDINSTYYSISDPWTFVEFYTGTDSDTYCMYDSGTYVGCSNVADLTGNRMILHGGLSGKTDNGASRIVRWVGQNRFGMENGSYFVKTFAYDDHSPLATGYVTYTGIFSTQNQVQIASAAISNASPIPGETIEVSGTISYYGAPSIHVDSDYYWVSLMYLHNGVLEPVEDANATKSGYSFSGLTHTIGITSPRYSNPGFKVIVDGYDGYTFTNSNLDHTRDVAASVQNVPPRTPDYLDTPTNTFTVGETITITAGYDDSPPADNNDDAVCYDIDVFNGGTWSRLVTCDANGSFSWDTSSAIPDLAMDFRVRGCDDMPSCSGWLNPAGTVRLDPSVYDPDPPTVVANGRDPVNSSRGTLHLTLDPGVNFPQTTYLIQETITNQYVQADGTLGSGEVWRTLADWGGLGGMDVVNLNDNTRYRFRVKAFNVVESNWTSTVDAYTPNRTKPAYPLLQGQSQRRGKPCRS